MLESQQQQVLVIMPRKCVTNGSVLASVDPLMFAICIANNYKIHASVNQASDHQVW